MSSLRLARWVSCFVIFASVVSCIVMAAIRSDGLAAVKVTAIPEPQSKPTGWRSLLHRDGKTTGTYGLVLIETDGSRVALGSRVDQDLAQGLEWPLPEPRQLSKISSAALFADGQIVDSKLAEVSATNDSATANGYRFEFKKTRSFSLGVRAFFGTPIGYAIAAGFAIAILILVLSAMG